MPKPITPATIRDMHALDVTGMAQVDIAERLNLSPSTVNKYIGGGRRVKKGGRVTRKPPSEYIAPRQKVVLSEHLICKWAGGDVTTISLGLGLESAVRTLKGIQGKRVPAAGYPRVEAFK